MSNESLNEDPTPNLIPPNPQVMGGANSHPFPPQQHADPMTDPKVMKKLAELGGLMVCAPVGLKILGEDGHPVEVKASLIDIILQIAQGAPLASSLHPVRRQDEGHDIIQRTSALQLLAEIADSLNDIACMGQEFLESQGIGDEEEEDEEDREDDRPRRGGAGRREYRK